MSSNAIEGLKPEILWQRFYEISQVPRPSKKEGKILEHMKSLFKELNLSYKQDELGNIVADVPATPGFEKIPVVVLQGHVDMVCEKNKDTKHDFDNDPIKLKREDGWITAEGTTLGSDNGIGLAAALAVITDGTVVHGPLQILFTVDEETGLTGASNMKPGLISGKTLINMDSEEDGAFYVGCSGGQDTIATFKIKSKKLSPGKVPYELMITGLKGGHSGLDIHHGRGNAIKILARILKALSDINYSVAKISGGSLRNAIPREAEVVLLIKPSDVKKVQKIIKELQASLLNEFRISDGGIKIKFNKISNKYKKVFNRSFTEKLINTLHALPNGVIAMSQDIPGLVETSTNLATVKTEDKSVIIGTSQRSSINSAKKYIHESVKSVFTLADANIETTDGYPGWKPNIESEILRISKDVFKKLFNQEPKIKAVHAGLECGILESKNPGLDMVSFGPTIQGAHSPAEKVNIETVDKFYSLLKGILKEIAEQNRN